MSQGRSPARKSGLASEIVRTRVNDRALLTSYVVPRDHSLNRVAAAEAVLEVSWRPDAPLTKVWNVYRDFNLWQNQHGYYWDGVVGEEEGNFVFMSDQVSSYGKGIPYLIRKAIPRQFICLESFPMPYGESGVIWTGHNFMSFTGDEKKATIDIYMEHTWLSPTENAEALLAISRSAVEGAVTFWKSSFIPRLEELVAAR